MSQYFSAFSASSSAVSERGLFTVTVIIFEKSGAISDKTVLTSLSFIIPIMAVGLSKYFSKCSLSAFTPSGLCAPSNKIFGFSEKSCKRAGKNAFSAPFLIWLSVTFNPLFSIAVTAVIKFSGWNIPGILREISRSLNLIISPLMCRSTIEMRSFLAMVKLLCFFIATSSITLKTFSS